MFLIDWIFLSIGLVLLLFGILLYVFSNKFFDFLCDYGLNIVFFSLGISFVLFHCFMVLLCNRCDVCETYVFTDYCTDCGSYVAGDSLCSCGCTLVEGYSFCPSCGCEVDVSFD